MPRRLFLPLIIGLWILVAGLLLRHAGLLVLAVPPILFTCVLVLTSLSFEAPTVHVLRKLSRHRATEGEEVDIVTEILIPFAHKCGGELSVIDDVPTSSELVRGENQFLGELLPDESVQLEYTIRLPRGVHHFPPARATAWSKWGWAGGRFEIQDEDLPGESVIVAEPATELLGAISIRPRRTRAFAGAVKANLGGQGLSFYSSRSYVPGDDVRRINWRAYARQGSLVVNEYELERMADVSIIVDARLIAHFRLGDETTFDHAVRAAGSLAVHFIRAGNIVGLLVYGDIIRWIFPGTGKVQERRILNSLAASFAAEREVFEDLANMPTRLFPARSQLVFVSPLVDDDDVEVIAQLIDRGYSLILVSPHASTWEAEQIASHDAASLAARIATLRRSLYLSTLVRAGAKVVSWDVAEPLGLAIERDLGASTFRRHR